MTIFFFYYQMPNSNKEFEIWSDFINVILVLKLAFFLIRHVLMRGSSPTIQIYIYNYIPISLVTLTINELCLNEIYTIVLKLSITKAVFTTQQQRCDSVLRINAVFSTEQQRYVSVLRINAVFSTEQHRYLSVLRINAVF